MVDPNDGTASYLLGMRGSTVSIALVQDGLPRLGVVYSPLYPDDAGDLIYGAEGQGLFRNGEPVAPRTFGPLTRDGVIMVSQSADRKTRGNLELVSPARFRAMPSIAYRLALVAAGEAEGAVSLQNPRAVDLAGGHALVRLAGGELYDERGQPLRYTEEADGVFPRVFAGTPELSARRWENLFTIPAEEARGPFPARLLPGVAVRDAGRLSRAQGCLLGQLAGDSLGSLVEFQDAEAIARQYPTGPFDLADGGCWGTLAGQPTDDSELALALARSLTERGFSPARVFSAYQDWLFSQPFDVGGTTVAGLQGRPNPSSQANGSLMRVAPLGLVPSASAPDWAEEDSALTHPHPNCRHACRAFVAAIRAGIEGGSARDMLEAARQEAAGDTLDWLREAEAGPPVEFQRHMGWVRIAFHNAFSQLLRAETLGQGVVDTVRRGGDTDTNGAIAGALLGALHGREAIPAQWRRAVLSCRPHPACGARHPRPNVYWPVDCLELAERLLLVE